MESDLEFSSATLRFFTKEYVKRQLQKLSATKLSDDNQLPSFNIYAAEEDLAKLESNLPASAKSQFISGHINETQSGFSSDISLRYRGGLPLHWLYEKKSVRIKLPAFTNYRGSRSFNLVNPSTIHTITDWISYDLAREIGLLTPEYFPARVFINDQNNGLHFYLEQVDESLLRKNKRMPGSIYSGDTINVRPPFGKKIGDGRETTFQTPEGTALMWHDDRLWQKDASRNAESTDYREDIKKYISVINYEDKLAFYRDFTTFF